MTNAVDPRIVQRVRDRIALTGVPPGAAGSATAGPAAFRAAVATALVDEGIAPDRASLPALVRDVADSVAGLGPIEHLLRLPGVTDVMVNGPGEVWIERDGRLQTVDVGFDSEQDVVDAVRRVIAPLGGRLDRSHPFVDARLPDGSRLHAVVAPVVDHGPVVTVRRFDLRQLDWEELTRTGAVPCDAGELLRELVGARRSVVVCGRTGVGKTTLLQQLLGEVGADERVVLIEDSPELRPVTRHVVRLRTRPANAEGAGEIDAGTLVRQSLRMRPDRIVIGEVRGREIADVLQALLTGHEGCMTTVHASSAQEALIRLEGLALQAGLPLSAAQAQIGTAVDSIVALAKDASGNRGVMQIATVDLRDRIPVATSIWERT